VEVTFSINIIFNAKKDRQNGFQIRVEQWFLPLAQSKPISSPIISWDPVTYYGSEIF